MRKNFHLNGEWSAMLYVVVIALSTIYIEQLGAVFPVLTLLFASTLVAVIAFNLLNYGKIAYSHRAIFAEPTLWFVTSFTILIAWLTSYYTTIYASPRFTMALTFVSIGFVASIFKRDWFKTLMCGAGLIFCGIYLPESTWLMFFLGFSSGASLFFYSKASATFAIKQQLSSIAVLSVRFYLLLLVSLAGFIWELSQYSGIISKIFSPYGLFVLVTLGISNRVLPMIFSQHSIQTIGPEQTSYLISFTPPVTFVLQALFEHDFSWPLFGATLFVTLALNSDFLIQVFWRSKKI